MNEAPAAVVLGIHLHDRPQLAVGSKHEISPGGRPAQAAVRTAAALVHVLASAWSPNRVDIEQVHEEIRAQHAHAIAEYPMGTAAAVGSQHPQAPHQNREFWGAQAQLLGPIQQQLLGADR